MGSQCGQIAGLPIGYRFVPTDEELVECYLMKKVSNGTLPPDVIRDIDAGKLYGKHPKSVVENMCDHEKAWYYFIHLNNLEAEEKTIRIVGDGIGFWRGLLAEDLIYNSNGDVYAAKTHWRYFKGPLFKRKRTYWTMEEYRLRSNTSTSYRVDQQEAEWVLVKIKKGKVYHSTF